MNALSVTGPTLVLSESFLANWKGIDGLSVPKDVVDPALLEAVESGDSPTDYDRACGVEGWISAIQTGDGSGIILYGGDPVSAFVKLGDGLGIFRWFWRESEAALLKLVAECDADFQSEKPVELYHPGGDLVMLAAVDSLPELGEETRKAPLEKGRYRVHTLEIRSQVTDAVMHRFERCAD
jgi:hypothetical protein